MAMDNDQLAREKELAGVYEVKMERRSRAIKELAVKHNSSKPKEDYRSSLYACFVGKFNEAFSRNKYEKPSEFFLKEMPWIFGTLVYDRYKEAFLHMADRVRDYPYSDTYYRRSFRSDSYLHYTTRIGRLLQQFDNTCRIDADIRDILSGNLPEDERCYIKHKGGWNTPYIPEMLAHALDQNDPELEAVVTEIVNGDNGFTRVSWGLIEGIVMSRNPRMHDLLCKLLLAAKLQEGLRQVICCASCCWRPNSRRVCGK